MVTVTLNHPYPTLVRFNYVNYNLNVDLKKFPNVQVYLKEHFGDKFIGYINRTFFNEAASNEQLRDKYARNTIYLK